MKLVKQIKLSFQEGKSDKVYEVDLCEVAADQYVVNFRYGRRGSKLKEGSKTTNPVTRQEADLIFDKLVSSKTQKGYQEGVPSTKPEADAQEQRADSNNETEHALISAAHKQAILRRLQAGSSKNAEWRLSRAVWRAGELRITEAEQVITGLIGSGDEMLDYCALWALGRCGKVGGTALENIQAVLIDNDASPKLRRIAMEARRALDPQWTSFAEKLIINLPTELQHPSETPHMAEICLALLAENKDPGFLELLYTLDHVAEYRATLVHCLQEMPSIQRPHFRRIRHILKAAEFRDDSAVAGIIYHRVCTSAPGFAYYPWQSAQDNARRNFGFTAKTKDYLNKRAWRQIKRLADIDDPRYCQHACDILAPFTDDNKDARHLYAYNYQARRYEERETYAWEKYWAFNHIVYGAHPDFSKNNTHRALPTNLADDKQQRHELYATLWDKHPQALISLVSRSHCEIIHEFACRILNSNQPFCDSLSIPDIIHLLNANYACTNTLGFDLAVKRYDAAHPNFDLICALAHCRLDQARKRAHVWIEEQRLHLATVPDVLVNLIFSPQTDTILCMQGQLQALILSSDDSTMLFMRIIAELLAPENNTHPALANVCQLLITVFERPMQEMNSDVIIDLLDSESEELHRLAGECVIRHKTLSQNPPAEILQKLLASSAAAVRETAVRIISQLPDQVLKSNGDALVSMSRHPLADIRQAIRPCVQRLIQNDPSFAAELGSAFIEALLQSGAPDGVPSHTALLLREDFSQHLKHISSALVWKLLRSRSKPAQEIGGLLLSSNVNPADLSVKEIAQLSHHQILSVREASWQICQEQIERIKHDLDHAIILFSSSWEDSRNFAKELFNSFDANDFMPKQLVAICDHVQTDVQQYGRDLLNKHFKAEHGVEFMLKLSEHPAISIQTHCTNYLNQFAVDNLSHLQELELYFVTVLSQVNKSRLAKDRVLAFLSQEAAKSKDAALFVARILTRQSVTNAITDKEQILQHMLSIQQAFPDLDLPLITKTAELRHGV